MLVNKTANHALMSDMWESCFDKKSKSQSKWSQKI